MIDETVPRDEDEAEEPAVVCDYCGDECDDEEIEVDGRVSCGCTVRCETCDRIVNADDIIGTLSRSSYDYASRVWTHRELTVCDRCAIHCEGCQDLILDDNAIRADDGRYCENCVEYCDECEEYFPEGIHSCDGGRNGDVHDYSYKPRPIFHGDGPLFLGIEHELEAKESRGSDVTDILEIVQRYDASEDVFYAKHDGSLSNGVEIVSHPMSVAYIEASYPFEMVRELARVASHRDSRGDSTAGVHVHLSKDAFSTYHLYRFLHFHYTLVSLIERVAGRSESHWAAFEREGHTDQDKLRRMVRQARKSDSNMNRYQAVNMQNDATVELRYFRSTVNADRMHGYVQWVAAVFEYTRAPETRVQCKSDRTREISEKNFMAWINARADEYPYALALITGEVA